MPVNPTPKYRVKYDGQNLPGYLQSEDNPFLMRIAQTDVIGRDGGFMNDQGAGFREVNLSFIVLSRLDHVTGLAHLGDCLDQYRDSLRMVARVASASTLFFGPSDHWMLAKFRTASNPLIAPDHRRIAFNMVFNAFPWFLGPEVTTTDAISGDDTIVLNMPDTRKTYPSFEIPPGITGIRVSHSNSGKVFQLNGSHANTITVNCSNLTIKDTAGANYLSMLTSGPDFGIYHVGSGSFTANISQVTGTGNVRVYMNPRLER